MSKIPMILTLQEGMEFYEHECGYTIKLVVTEAPLLLDKQCKWKGTVTEGNIAFGIMVGSEVDFLITQGYEGYGPNISLAGESDRPGYG